MLFEAKMSQPKRVVEQTFQVSFGSHKNKLPNTLLVFIQSILLQQNVRKFLMFFLLMKNRMFALWRIKRWQIRCSQIEHRDSCIRGQWVSEMLSGFQTCRQPTASPVVLLGESGQWAGCRWTYSAFPMVRSILKSPVHSPGHQYFASNIIESYK